MGVVRLLIVPLQASSLRSLTGPKSPASPLSPLRAELHSPILASTRSTLPSPALSRHGKAAEAPPQSMPWVWSCHKCHTRYPLGATRRCLHDGHYFCGGMTVDKITGKTKKHRACASEFDYIGWENYGNWKRNTVTPGPRTKGKASQNCEQQCDFPSACHWKAKRTPREEANFEFLDPKCLGTEPALPSEVAGKPSTMPSLKKTGLFIDKIVKAAEKRTVQLTTLLSTIDEEKNFASTPGYVSASTSSPGKTSAPPSLNGLGLSFPVMDFSSLRKPNNEDVKRSISTPIVATPDLPTSANTTDDDEVEMMDWLSAEPISPTTKTPLNEISFTFSDDPRHGPQASLADEDEALDSPRRNPWDWTAGESEIGIALGSPTEPACEEAWEGHGEEETEVKWERELALLDKKLGF